MHIKRQLFRVWNLIWLKELWIFYRNSSPACHLLTLLLVYFCKWNFVELRWTGTFCELCLWYIAYSLEYKYQNYTFHFNKQFHLWLQKCSTNWSVDTVYSSQIYSYRFQIREKAPLGFFLPEGSCEYILDLVIPLRCPHLQPAYAFTWPW